MLAGQCPRAVIQENHREVRVEEICESRANVFDMVGTGGPVMTAVSQGRGPKAKKYTPAGGVSSPIVHVSPGRRESP